ncbi:MAG: PEP-CTERM sorting domain-containing protein [Armatimonadota bacterium]
MRIRFTSGPWLFFLVPVCLTFSSVQVSCSYTVTSGGEKKGVRVREKFTVHQNKFDEATDLHFKLWQEEDNINVNGWEVSTSGFTNSTSRRGNQPEWPSQGGRKCPHEELKNHPHYPKTDNPDNGQHAVDVEVDGGTIKKCQWVYIDSEFYMEHWNTKRMSDVNWTNDSDPVGKKKAVPDFGWSIDDPVPAFEKPARWVHWIKISNDDPLDSLWLKDIRLIESSEFYRDLYNVPFGDPVYPDQILAPGESIGFWFPGMNSGGFLYGSFALVDAVTGEIVAEERFEHPFPEPASLALCAMGLGMIAAVRRRSSG